MNTLRQLSARIVRQCAVAAACAFNAVCVMQRCCAAPLPRKFEIKFALRRIGILTGFAVCVLTFAATDAQAQTSCDAGERSVVASSTGCVSNADADIADACIAADWTIGGFPPNNLRCNIRVRLYNRDGGSNFNSRCAIVEPSVDPSCRLMFGDPPQFPDKAEAVNLATDIYVANCSRDGTIPNTIPATVNTIGATECTCDSSIGGVTGAWPNCACPTGQGVLANRVCGACASGEGVLANGACGACTGGEGVLANGVCGDCPAGGIPINGVCTCPDGEGRRDDNTCGDCPAGRILQNGICTSCPTGQGVLASGVCGVCTGGEGVLANGACGVCTGGQSVQDGVCQCPAGKIFTDGNCVTPTPAQKCTLAGWTYDPYIDPTFISLSGEGDCDIPTVNSKTGNSILNCDINSPENNSRRCVIRFGPNYDFPKRPSDGSSPTYVFNCDPDDETGLIPATVNTIGATSCACPAGGSVVNGMCACPTGQVVEGDACAACTGGRVVIEGACACPTGGVLFNGVCTCPDGQGVRDDNTCGVCLSGTTLQNGICTSCPTGQGILADGSCGACTGGQEVQNGACACPAGQLIKSGVCAAPTTPEEKCTVAKWSYNFGEDACYINFKISGGSNQMACQFGKGPAFLDYIPCEDVFGADYSLPLKPSGSNPVYVYNCDPNDESGLIPATINTIGATECTCPAGQTLQDGVCVAPSAEGCGGLTPAQGYDSTAGACVACIAGQSVYNGVCACPVGQIVLNNACAVCADGEIAYRGVCTDASVLELSGKALTLYNLIAGSISDLDDGSFRSNALKEFQQGILDRHNGVANYIGNLNDFYTGTRSSGGAYGEFLVLSQTAGFGDIRGGVPGEIDRILSQIPVHTSGSSSAPFGLQACQNAGWIFSADDGGSCGVPLTLSGGAVSNKCNLSGSDSPQCSAVFGSTVNYFPSPTLSADGATLRFVYNCDPDSENGLIPARANTIMATECACAAAGEEIIGGFCVASAVVDKCESAGWGLSAAEGSCGILVTLAGGSAADECYFSGSTSPQCEEVFGGTVNYFPSPTLAADGATLRFVYNCDPDGESGLIPATANTIAATECGCESGASFFSDVCIREEGDLGLADELLCGAFGGTVRTATGGREVCSGMDANDTFCIMDSAVGFPCRGLFKHLRSCNLEFNRKALNPFFCGEKCGVQKAVGSECR